MADALLVPAEAVAVEKAGSFVFLLADGKARRTPVRTGFTDGVNVEVVDGIAAGAQVILVGKRAQRRSARQRREAVRSVGPRSRDSAPNLRLSGGAGLLRSCQSQSTRRRGARLARDVAGLPAAI